MTTPVERMVEEAARRIWESDESVEYKWQRYRSIYLVRARAALESLGPLETLAALKEGHMVACSLVEKAAADRWTAKVERRFQPRPGETADD